MKKLLFIIAFFCALSYNGQIVTSSCSAPDSIVWKYRDDADKMAVRRVYHIESNYADTIAVNKQIRDKYLQALIAVYNATAVPARDSVVKMFDIHIFENKVSKLVLRADSNLQWMKNLRTNSFPVGNTSLDNLISKYYLKTQQYFHNLNAPKADALLKADTNCNIDALADTIRNIPGVLICSNDWAGGDGDRIEDSITTNYVWLVYSHGWGDCYAGCTFRKFWQFKVYNDCSVEYGGTFGAPLDVGIKENIPQKDFTIYPNPTTGEIYIKNLDHVYDLTITDILGRTVKSQKLEGEAKIDISECEKGIYFFNLRDGVRIKSLKVLKE